MKGNQNKIIFIVVAVVLVVIGYGILTMPDQRSAGQRVGDAVDALPKGVGEAAEQLEKRTPGEKLGDAIGDATDNKPND